MNLKEYIGLGLLLGLIAVFAMLTVVMSDSMVLQIFAAVVVLVMCLSSVVYANALDSFLLKRKFECVSGRLDKLLEEAWENVYQDTEKAYLLVEVNRLNSQIAEIKKQQLDNKLSLTSSIFGLSQIEGGLVCLIEIQSIIIKIKKYLDEVESIFVKNANDNVKATLLLIRSFYKRACDSLPGLVYVSYSHKLNLYRTIFGRAETEYNLIVLTTRSIKTNGEPK